MISSGKMPENSAFAGKDFSIDWNADLFHVRLADGETAHSEYVLLKHSDRYMVVDFDRDDHVLGLSIDGLMEEFKRLVPGSRIILSLHASKLMAGYFKKHFLNFLRDESAEINRSLPIFGGAGSAALG